MKKVFLLWTCFLISMGLAIAQTKQVSGTVTDESGEPVVGASVFVKGNAAIGTATNVDGKFTLTVPNSAQTLVVKFLGMQEQEVAVAPNMKITLQTSESKLDEVIVVAYGTATKGTFTGSASVVKAEDLSKRQVSNVSQALSGAVAGVQILSANGQPGVSATVRIRGVGSINAGTAPLYVVDGVPFDGDLSSINPNDVETMTVLKDAASTALYGARGANGIIMITTKKGTSGKANISFDARYGVNSRAITNYEVFTSPENYIETQYKAIYNAGLYNLNYTPAQANIYANNRLSANSEGGSGYKVFTVPDGQFLVGSNGKINPNAVLGYKDAKYYYTPDNWGKEMFRNNPRQEYNLVFSGSQNDFNYYASFGYLNDEGIIDNSGFSRISSRLKADYQMKKWLKVGANVNYNYAVSKYPGEQTNTTSSGNAFFIANNIAPIYPIYVRNADGTIKIDNNRKAYDYGDGISTNFQRGFMQIANPLGDLLYNKRDFLMDIVNANTFAEIKPVQGLTLTAKYGIHIDNTRHHDMGNAYMGQSAQYGGTVYQETNRTFGLDQQYLANYQFNLNGPHQMDITAGYDGYSYSYEYVSAYGINMYNTESYYASNVIDQFSIGGEKDNYATQGYFARVNYSYDEKYFANVAYRRDASSRFHPDKRWGNFWSASAAWILDKESFLQDISWVNLLKLKASYGQQGNDAIGNYYAYLDQYSVRGANGVFSDGVLYYKGNPDLTWETSNSYNVGFDLSLFDNKLEGTIEYFGRTSSDMLYNKPVAGSLGYPRIPMNIGSMTNSGLEVDLAYNIIKTNNLKWTVNANATMIKNVINKLHPDLHGRLEDGTRVYEEGHSMYRMFLPEYAGVDPQNGMALYWAKDDKGNRITTNDYTIAQQYKIDTDDLLAKVYGGFGTGVEAFGVDASIQFSYQLGGQIYDNGYARLMHGGTSSFAGTNWHKDILKAWSPENPNTDVPRLDTQDRYANSASTRFLTSSDYLSLNNITVGYTLPSKLLKKIDISRLRVYFAGDNIYLLSARKGLDPRQSYTAATTSLYTPIRSISGGISLTF